jgi:hypothetical protein
MAFDYSEFERFTDKYNNLALKFQFWMTAFMYREGQRFINEVKPRTPVDTGNLRGAWRLAGVTREGEVLRVWFVNRMDYATEVEYGHAKPYMSGIATYMGPDWVEGYFMMTVSIDVIERNLPRHFETEFKSFLSSLEVL